MAHHGSHLHSQISRLLKARHRPEAHEGELSANETKDDPDSLIAEPLQKPDLPVSDLSSEVCDPLQNQTCLEDVTDIPDMPWKREPADSNQAAVATVVQVVDTKSHTLWQSTGADVPMTISHPTFGSLTRSGSSISTPAPIFSAPVSLLPATQPRISPSLQTSAPTSIPLISTQSGPTASPSSAASAAISSPSSTPLIISTTTTSSISSTPLTLAYSSHSSSENASTRSSSGHTTTPETNSVFGDPKETGTATSTGFGTGSSTGGLQPSSASGSPGQPGTPAIVGSVVGSVAGFAMLFVLLFYYLKRRKFFLRQIPDGLPSHDAGETREFTDNNPLFTASYFAPAFMKRWRHSAQEGTLSSDPSERGFQKISGRKIPSVLTAGGDGYGDGFEGDSPTIPEFMTGLSPTSPGGPRYPPSSHAPPRTNPFSSPLDPDYTQESAENGHGLTRPSPTYARSVNVATPTTVTPSYPILPPQSARPRAPPVPPRPEGQGRSIPSGSRFTESLDR